MAGVDEPMIRLERISKSFGGAIAVDDVSIEIARGEFFSLLGPSGCGKTTTLRMIAGFEEPTAGRVLLDGEDVTLTSPRRRNVNMVFQDYALFPHMSVAENVGFGPKLKRVGRGEMRTRIDEMLAVVRLEGLGDRRPAELSGGQRQRVALARALVNRPAALLLDEPLGALDLKLRREMQFELKRIQKTTGTTFVYVTHDQEEALTMSDRIAVMDGGRVQQLADPKTLYEQPETSFVADFIGTSNALELCVDRRDGELAIMEPAAGVRVVVSARCSVGDTLQVSIRPEKISITAGEPAAEAAANGSRVKGVAVERVYLGSVSQTVVELPGGDRIAVHELNDDDASEIEPGDTVTLSWPARHSLVVAGEQSPEPPAVGEGVT
ncbi:MAG TPA: ABC transporter ATP-binding protein [Solirubrobacterales bacterium]|nr:ABC transporter ATP-binding protein [Solirubrobacterales bacterium]